jgi:hypothetical protein
MKELRIWRLWGRERVMNFGRGRESCRALVMWLGFPR